MSTALITGATGFIGTHLARRLLTLGHRVVCLVRPTSRRDRLSPLGVEFVYGDVNEPASLLDAVAGVDTVFHLAGLVKALRGSEMMRVNAVGASHIAAACAHAADPPVLILVSSLAAAGPSTSKRKRVETERPSPVSTYGISKRAAEEAVAAYADRVPVTVVRPSIVFGEGDPATLQIFRPVARFGLHFTPGLFDRWFSLVHVADVAEAIRLAAERGERLVSSDAPGEENYRGYYFVADEEPVTYAELGRRIATALGRRGVRVIRTPNAGTWTVAAASHLVSLLRRRPHALNLDKAREATAGCWTCSAMRARRELGFQPAASLDERLGQTARWYRDEGWL